MKTYFTLLSHSTQAKNKLQQEIWTMLEEQSNRVTDDLELSIVEIRNKVIELNEKHPRCQPLSVSEGRHTEDNINLYIRLPHGDQGPGVSFSYHLIKK